MLGELLGLLHRHSELFSQIIRNWLKNFSCLWPCAGIWNNAAAACHLVKGMSRLLWWELEKPSYESLYEPYESVPARVITFASGIPIFSFCWVFLSLLVSSTVLLQRGKIWRWVVEFRSVHKSVYTLRKYFRTSCLLLLSTYVFRSLMFTDKSPWLCYS